MSVEPAASCNIYGCDSGFAHTTVINARQGARCQNPITGALAQDWSDDADMQGDAYAIQRGHQELRHDSRELRDDLRRGDYGAAAHEQAEMAQRRYNMEQREQDLNNDVANRYYNQEA